tara:strand:- start:137 stop:928 length:792 start_codon:yes stop_codon:yes gene_type:complete
MTCIYEITVGDETYIGSTCNYKRRMNKHKYDCYNSHRSVVINLPLYKAIRANDGIYDSKIIYILKDGEHKGTIEREWYDKLKPKLNGQKPIRYEAEIKADKAKFQKTWADKNPRNEKMTCDCGLIVNARHIIEHRLTQVHINLMNPEYIKPIPLTLEEKSKKRREQYKKKKSTIVCECGSEVAKWQINAHRKTKKHINLMNPEYKEPIPLTEEQKKEKRKDYMRDYGKMRNLLTVTCECGRVVKERNLVDHMKRKCHTDIMNS